LHLKLNPGILFVSNVRNQFIMKNWKFLAILFALASTVAVAQHGKRHQGNKWGEKQNPEARAAKITETLTEKLALTSDQKQKVSNLTLARITQTREAKKVYSKDKESFKAKASAIQDEYRKQMKATLTAEQLTKLKAWRNELKAEKAERMQARDADFLDGIE